MIKYSTIDYFGPNVSVQWLYGLNGIGFANALVDGVTGPPNSYP